MPKTLPNGATVQTASDRFSHVEALRKLGVLLGAIPAVQSKAAAKALVEQIKSDPAYSGDFVWLIYVRDEETLYFHDGTSLRES